MPDDLWEEFKLVLSPEKPARTVGRPTVSNRNILDAIPYVPRSVCQWKKIPKEELSLARNFIKNTRSRLMLSRYCYS